MREAASLSQGRLAARAGIARWRITHAENGLLELHPAEVEALKKILLRAVRENLRLVEAAVGAASL